MAQDSDYIVDAFDRIRAGMDGRPDVTRTRISTVRSVDPLVGNVSTFLIESIRVKDVGDTIFLEVANKDGNIRIVIPPKGANVIARQRDSLANQVRSKLAKAQAKARKEAGIEPFGGKRYRRQPA
jgi:tRNA A37 threonylcarbamoyladenosine dehydratase